MPSKQIVEAFIAAVVSGLHVEAIERFYAPDATMQENLNPPRQGWQICSQTSARPWHDRKKLRRGQWIFMPLPATASSFTGYSISPRWKAKHLRSTKSACNGGITTRLWRSDFIMTPHSSRRNKITLTKSGRVRPAFSSRWDRTPPLSTNALKLK